jgi:hypothetical protein
VHSYGGAQARTFCGPARARAKVGGEKFRFKRGKCERKPKYVSVNIGTIVFGSTTKKKPDYFGLNVGETPAGGTPAPKDGTYDDATISFNHDGKGYAVGNASVTLTNKRTRGTFSGELFDGGPVSGSFRCK